ncbi:beta-galactosidase [Rhipicephalus microplus]|uniref:beta-galactosidase n=1 Tax=Rhipicephalus microplus TaxID=6941 RepID=UPI003F6BBB09
MEGMDVWSLTAILVILATPASCGRSFYIDYDKHTFVKDGQPFRLVGGSMHYFRVPRSYWDDRLYKLRMGGLNAVDFYIDWSGHEPEPEQYNFIDNYDVVAYLEAIKKADLLAVIRPGPFICGEVENGGYPYWLLRKHPNIRYRSTQKEYVDEVTKWFNKLLPMLVPYLYKNGGPIIMFQVENEYGHLDNGCDPKYMEFMLTLQEKGLGKDVVMFRTNFPYEQRFYCDKVRDILVAGNCDPKCNMSIFNTIRKVQVKPGGPLLVAEYYTGWMNFWGWDNNPAYPPAVIDTFKKMMDEGANIIIYMYHGGTSFGFKAATSSDAPLVTSYDYDAPIGEDGDPKDYYYSLRDVIGKYLPLKQGDAPKGSPKLKLDVVYMTHVMTLAEVMDHFRWKGWLRRTSSKYPVTFEQLGQDYGFLVYSTEVRMDINGSQLLTVHALRDMAQLFVRDERHMMRCFPTSRLHPVTNATVKLTKGEKISIFVENMGREDFGQKNLDPKGMQNVTVNGVNLTDWTIEAVPVTRNRDLTELMRLLESRGKGDVDGKKKTPRFFHGTFKLREGQKPLDTFLDPGNYTKGIAFINGINLGRYWPAAGPQIRLYVPGVFLRPHPEENKLIMFEVEGLWSDKGERGVRFDDKPYLTADTGSPHP